MVGLAKGQFAARLADSPADLAAAQALRYRVFRSVSGEVGCDQDSFDQDCAHVLIEVTDTGQLVCCLRLLSLINGSDIARSYAAQFYDLSGLHGFEGRMAEMGRFCIHSDFANDPDILRIALGAITQFVDGQHIKMLFGCSSFAGTDPRPYVDTFALLKRRHLAPTEWQPKVKAPDVVRFAKVLAQDAGNCQAVTSLPPLLRSYLMMGGWVSDHAVVDYDLKTLHVFTGLEIDAIPPARAKVLRSVAWEQSSEMSA